MHESPTMRLKEVGRAAAERQRVRQRWEEAIRAASAIGFTDSEIAVAAECSRPTVATIVRNGRGGEES